MTKLLAISALFTLMLTSSFIKPSTSTIKTIPCPRDYGLVAYYPFNGNALDESPYNNHPIFNNATLTKDRAGNANGAYLFNGMNNYMQIPNSPTLNPKFISIFAIVKVSGFYTGRCHGNVILNKGDTDWDVQDKYRLRFADDVYTRGANCYNQQVDTFHQAFYADFGNNGHMTYDYNGPYIQSGKWYCLAYTYDGKTARFYIDGTEVSSKRSRHKYRPSYEDLFIGRLNNDQFPYWFNGAIDEIRIYNRALSHAEVVSLCTDQSCPPQPDLFLLCFIQFVLNVLCIIFFQAERWMAYFCKNILNILYT
jgi:hypothetical protein